VTALADSSSAVWRCPYENDRACTSWPSRRARATTVDESRPPDSSTTAGLDMGRGPRGGMHAGVPLYGPTPAGLPMAGRARVRERSSGPVGARASSGNRGIGLAFGFDDGDGED